MMPPVSRANEIKDIASPDGSGLQTNIIERPISIAPHVVKEHFADDPVVFVIDDDASVRLALKSLFESVGLHVQLFASANGFLESQVPDAPSCLVLEVRLPGRSGLELQQELKRTNIRTPVIFLTGHGDIPMSVRAMKAGAVEFLTKPLRDQDILDAVFAALLRDRARREYERSISMLWKHFETLSAREKDVVQRVVAGRLNKQIAAELGIAEITVKVHRANAMRKIQARSLAELIRMVDRLGTISQRDPGVRSRGDASMISQVDINLRLART